MSTTRQWGSIKLVELLYGRPDHRPSDPINPTRPTRKKTQPDQVTGQVRAEIFDPKLKKNPHQSENYIQKYGPTRPNPDSTRPNHVMSRARANIFLTRNQKWSAQRIIRSNCAIYLNPQFLSYFRPYSKKWLFLSVTCEINVRKGIRW